MKKMGMRVRVRIYETVKEGEIGENGRNGREKGRENRRVRG